MIDLHMHSTISDGTDTPEVIVERCADIGLHAFALTDHDTLEHIPLARAAAKQRRITFVPGCELSCEADIPGALHLLVYFVEPGCELDHHLDALQSARHTRNGRMMERLAELGMPVSEAEVAVHAGVGVVGRPHIALAMLDHGYVDSIDDAFDRWLGDDCPAYVERERLEVGTAIALAHASGGVAVVAHPRSLGVEDNALATYLATLRDRGLDGVECNYANYSPETRQTLADIAASVDLVATGGSDYHGTVKPTIQIGVGTGDLHVADSVLDALAARRP
ncbi:MAG: PHP domain-containing protein [Acidimicrobiia bacterium]